CRWAGWNATRYDYQKALIIMAAGNTKNFGSWTRLENGLRIDAERLCRGEFTVEANTADAGRSPSPRARLATLDPSTTASVRLRSTRPDWPIVPGHAGRVRVYVYTPPSLEDASSLRLNFDLFNDDPSDAGDGCLFLTGAGLATMLTPTATRPEPTPLPTPAPVNAAARRWQEY
ncbi:MAG: hypothetical protein M1457_05240, partial [bacterium]|nr:hypothetical protein [bacterium]